MRKTVVLAIIWLAACAVMRLTAAPIDDLPPEARSRQQFQEIAARIDMGGDLFFIGNVDDMLERLVHDLTSPGTNSPAGTPEEQLIDNSLDRMRLFLKKSGLLGLKGFGTSIAPKGKGIHSVKMFIQRDYVDSSFPFWRGFFGWQPRRLESVDFLPGDTAFAHVVTMDLKTIWGLIVSAVHDVASPTTAHEFDERVRALNEALGVSVNQLLSSLGDELFVSVQLSPDETGLIPSAAGFITVPRYSFLVGTATRDDTLRALIEIQFARKRFAMVEKAVEDNLMRYVKNPLPAPMVFQPAYASLGGYFIMGSSPDIVENALLAFSHKSGLASRRSFQTAFRDLKMVNNGVTYVAPEMGALMTGVQSAHLHAARDPMAEHPAYDRLVTRLFDRGRDISCAYVIQNWKSGVMITGNSSRGGKEAMENLLTPPAGILTDLLIREKWPLFLLDRWTNSLR